MKTALLAFCLTACATVPPTPTPSPTGTIYEQACANLARIGCADGLPAACPAALHTLATGDPIIGGPLTRIDVPCLASAGTVAEARACGGVKCAP